MKSYVAFLQGLYAAFFSQIAVDYPRLRIELIRDSSRLRSLVDTRGLPFLMIDLPSAGKHLDRCLAEGRLTQSGVAGFRPYKKGSTIPRLFKGLYKLVFDDNGVLQEDLDSKVILYLRQLLYGAKKVKIPCDESKTWEHVHEFFQVDQECRSPSLSWDEDDISIDHARRLHFRDAFAYDVFRSNQARLFVELEESEPLSLQFPSALDDAQNASDIVSGTLGRFDPLRWRVKHGPGAVSDQHHTLFKYDFPSWPDKLANVFPLAEFGFANLSCWADMASDERFEGFSPHEPPSKLIAVPKTLKGPRLIAAEPVCHQWAQQSIMDFMVGNLWRTPIWGSVHFRDQTQNQEFAKLASHTQSHVTIDLSSASDRLSCWVVERFFRRNQSLLEALHATRTRWVVNTIDRKSPKYSRIKKFACMGSACTFPVQSYVFATMACSSLLTARGLPVTIRNLRAASREVRVFGDDIIVPNDAWVVLQGLLRYLGLEVNQQKTYDSGRFRESCGLDAYDGTDVTPVYSITHPDVSRPESIASLIATHNNFAKRGFWHVAEYVRSTVMKQRRFALPFVPVGSGILGWYHPLGFDFTHLRRRWNEGLQRVEYQVDRIKTTVNKVVPERNSVLLQYFTEVTKPPLSKEVRLGHGQRPAISLRRGWEPLVG